MNRGIRTSRLVGGLLGLGLLAATALGTASPAIAAREPGRFERAQAGLDYTVYAPSGTAGLKRTGFQLFACGQGDESINADFGSEATRASRWISLNESSKPCLDGPDEVGPAATFMVRGAKATVMGACPGGTSTCAASSPALVRRSAYTTVTLPSGGDGLSSTFVEVYSQNLSLAEVKEFVTGLRPVS